MTALASITQDWYNATDSGSLYNGVHVVFVDFRKAFDLVDHGVLLTKLAGMGITKSFWKWTQSYLSGRTQQVKLPGVLSRHGEVIAGVSQGGVISPTLFNVHVNDIEDCIPRGIPVSTCKCADDCTLYELVVKDSVSQMQDAVTHLERWAVQNKMELNAKKTKDMWITFKKFLLLLISGLLNWRGFQSLNYWVYMYRTISSGIHMSQVQVLSAKRVNGSTILGSVEQPISPATLVLQLTSLRLDLF